MQLTKKHGRRWNQKNNNDINGNNTNNINHTNDINNNNTMLVLRSSTLCSGDAALYALPVCLIRVVFLTSLKTHFSFQWTGSCSWKS